jgi:hypothetical protein
MNAAQTGSKVQAGPSRSQPQLRVHSPSLLVSSELLDFLRAGEPAAGIVGDSYTGALSALMLIRSLDTTVPLNFGSACAGLLCTPNMV